MQATQRATKLKLNSIVLCNFTNKSQDTILAAINHLYKSQEMRWDKPSGLTFDNIQVLIPDNKSRNGVESLSVSSA